MVDINLDALDKELDAALDKELDTALDAELNSALNKALDKELDSELDQLFPSEPTPKEETPRKTTPKVKEVVRDLKTLDDAFMMAEHPDFDPEFKGIGGGAATHAIKEGGKDVIKNIASFLDTANEYKAAQFEKAGDTAQAEKIRAEGKSDAVMKALDYEWLQPDLSFRRNDIKNPIGRYVYDFLNMIPQIGTQIGTAVTAGPIAGMAFMATQIAGGDARALKAEGVDIDTRWKAALTDAAVQAPLEAIGILPITKIGGKFAGSTMWKAIQRWKPGAKAAKRLSAAGGSAALEWFTEFLQAQPEMATHAWAIGQKNGLSDDQILDQIWNGIGEAARRGAYEGLVAAPFGLLGGGVVSPQDFQLKNYNTDALRGFTEDIDATLAEANAEEIYDVEGLQKRRDQIHEEILKRTNSLIDMGDVKVKPIKEPKVIPPTPPAPTVEPKVEKKEDPDVETHKLFKEFTVPKIEKLNTLEEVQSLIDMLEGVAPEKRQKREVQKMDILKRKRQEIWDDHKAEREEEHARLDQEIEEAATPEEALLKKEEKQNLENETPEIAAKKALEVPDPTKIDEAETLTFEALRTPAVQLGDGTVIAGDTYTGNINKQQPAFVNEILEQRKALDKYIKDNGLSSWKRRFGFMVDGKFRPSENVGDLIGIGKIGVKEGRARMTDLVAKQMDRAAKRADEKLRLKLKRDMTDQDMQAIDKFHPQLLQTVNKKAKQYTEEGFDTAELVNVGVEGQIEYLSTLKPETVQAYLDDTFTKEEAKAFRKKMYGKAKNKMRAFMQAFKGGRVGASGATFKKGGIEVVEVPTTAGGAEVEGAPFATGALPFRKKQKVAQRYEEEITKPSEVRKLSEKEIKEYEKILKKQAEEFPYEGLSNQELKRLDALAKDRKRFEPSQGRHMALELIEPYAVDVIHITPPSEKFKIVHKKRRVTHTMNPKTGEMILVNLPTTEQLPKHAKALQLDPDPFGDPDLKSFYGFKTRNVVMYKGRAYDTIEFMNEIGIKATPVKTDIPVALEAVIDPYSLMTYGSEKLMAERNYILEKADTEKLARSKRTRMERKGHIEAQVAKIGDQYYVIEKKGAKVLPTEFGTKADRAARQVIVKEAMRQRRAASKAAVKRKVVAKKRTEKRGKPRPSEGPYVKARVPKDDLYAKEIQGQEVVAEVVGYRKKAEKTVLKVWYYNKDGKPVFDKVAVPNRIVQSVTEYRPPKRQEVPDKAIEFAEEAVPVVDKVVRRREGAMPKIITKAIKNREAAARRVETKKRRAVSEAGIIKETVEAVKAEEMITAESLAGFAGKRAAPQVIKKRPTPEQREKKEALAQVKLAAPTKEVELDVNAYLTGKVETELDSETESFLKDQLKDAESVNFLKNEKGEAQILNDVSKKLIEGYKWTSKTFDIGSPFAWIGGHNTAEELRVFHSVGERWIKQSEVWSRELIQKLKEAGVKKATKKDLGEVVLMAEAKNIGTYKRSIIANAKKSRKELAIKLRGLLSKEKRTKRENKRVDSLTKALRDIDERIEKFKDPEYLKKLTPAAQYMKKVFKEAEVIAAKHGITLNFQDRMLRTLREKRDAETDPIKKRDIEETMRELKQTRFVHIPAKLWALGKVRKFVAQGQKKQFDKEHAKMKTALLQERRAISMGNLVKKGVVPIEKLNPFEIFFSYGRNLGHDIAIANVRNAAASEGLIKHTKKKPSPTKKAGQFAKIPPNLELLGYSKKRGITSWASIKLIQALDSQVGVWEKQNWWDKAMAMTKMMTFYNPIILPFYDIVQAIMISPVGVAKGLGGGFIKSWQDVRSHSDIYMEALRFGAMSKPFETPFRELESRAAAHTQYIKSWESDPKGSMASLLKETFARGVHTIGVAVKTKGALQKTGALINLAYSGSWQFSWFLDEVVRLNTYKYLKSRGKSARTAGRLTARFHGDYASIPPHVRKSLNRVFYTPSFKIAMWKLWGGMIKGAVKTVVPGLKSTSYDRSMAAGLVYTTMLMGGIHMAMTHVMGFEPDEENFWLRYFVRKFGKKMKTPWGRKRAMFTVSTPFNVPFRHILKAVELTRTPAGQQSKLQQVLRSFEWEFHPMLTRLVRLVGNRTETGEDIVGEFDDPSTQLAKWIAYVSGAIGLLDKVAFDWVLNLDEKWHPRSKKEQQMIKDQVLQGSEIKFHILDGLGMMYLTETKKMRKIKRLKALLRRYKKAEKEYIKYHSKRNVDYYQNAKGMYERYLQEIKEMD